MLIVDKHCYDICCDEFPVPDGEKKASFTHATNVTDGQKTVRQTCYRCLVSEMTYNVSSGTFEQDVQPYSIYLSVYRLYSIRALRSKNCFRRVFAFCSFVQLLSANCRRSASAGERRSVSEIGSDIHNLKHSCF